jgi:hypothetical protein
MNDKTVILREQAPPELRKGAAWAATTLGLLSRWSGTAIRTFIVGLAILLIGVVAVEWNVWVGSAILQTTDDAYLRADITPLAGKSPGYVRSVRVQDFQKVKAGDLLVEIHDLRSILLKSTHGTNTTRQTPSRPSFHTRRLRDLWKRAYDLTMQLGMKGSNATSKVVA